MKESEAIAARVRERTLAQLPLFAAPLTLCAVMVLTQALVRADQLEVVGEVVVATVAMACGLAASWRMAQRQAFVSRMVWLTVVTLSLLIPAVVVLDSVRAQYRAGAFVGILAVLMLAFYLIPGMSNRTRGGSPATNASSLFERTVERRMALALSRAASATPEALGEIIGFDSSDVGMHDINAAVAQMHRDRWVSKGSGRRRRVVPAGSLRIAAKNYSKMLHAQADSALPEWLDSDS